jgi:hypothetical protein
MSQSSNFRTWSLRQSLKQRCWSLRSRHRWGSWKDMLQTYFLKYKALTGLGRSSLEPHLTPPVFSGLHQVSLKRFSSVPALAFWGLGFLGVKKECIPDHLPPHLHKAPPPLLGFVLIFFSICYRGSFRNFCLQRSYSFIRGVEFIGISWS